MLNRLTHIHTFELWTELNELRYFSFVWTAYPHTPFQQSWFKNFRNQRPKKVASANQTKIEKILDPPCLLDFVPICSH